MASEKPDRPSLQAIRISDIPQFFSLLHTPSQKLALSVSPIHMPGCLLTGYVDAKNAVGSLVDNPVVLTDFKVDRVQEYYRVDFLQRYGPPLGYLRHDLVGYSATRLGGTSMP
jgi:hypothetical protein